MSNQQANTKTNWKKVAWKTKTDADISRETGYSRPTVAAKRKEFGSPRKSKWENVNWEKERNADIAEKLGVSAGAVSVYRRLHNKPECDTRYQREEKSRKYPRHLFNWLLPNADLQDIWELPNNYAANLRQMLDVPDAKWDKRMGVDRASAEYRRAVGQEKSKATNWKKRQVA